MKTESETRRNDVVMAVLIVLACTALGYMMFLRGALAEKNAPDSTDLSVEQIEVKADPQTRESAKTALADADLDALIEQAAAGNVEISEIKDSKSSADVQGTGDLEGVAAFVARLSGDLRFAGGSQIRGSKPLVAISDLSASASGSVVQFRLTASRPEA